MASVVDFTGATLAEPFEFDLDRRGVEVVAGQVRAVVPESVQLIRVGLEAADHYHLPLAGGALPAWRALLTGSGFEPTSTTETSLGWRVIDAAPR